MSGPFDQAPRAEAFEANRDFAQSLDDRDPLASRRDLFALPHRPGREEASGESAIYFCGNSLGLMPRAVPQELQVECDDWARLAVEAHFEGVTPWYSYHEVLREPAAAIVGAQPHEVVVMNSLTANLHFMMVSFYRPTKSRYRILIDGPTFPSDVYAVQSQLRVHGFDPADGLIHFFPEPGAETHRTERLIEEIEARGDELALVLLAGVNYATGQFYDIEAITRAARARGVPIGWDLAHAAGNVPLKLHEWGPDFAAWCSYKYLNSGPGAVAGCFVHERHARNIDLPRFAGWWGNDPAERFRMEPKFQARPTADGWQLSNPPIMALAPMRVSYGMFREVGLEALRRKSLWLTGYLEWLVDRLGSDRVRVITPRDPERRGAQLSLQIPGRDGRAFLGALKERGVIADFREPDIIRVAPVPLYNTFEEVFEFASILDELTQ
ncbi:MAG: kynureninase [Phycisphaerales bacterium]